MGYDAKATRERILRAATAEFAGRGVAGARIDRIAAAAEANKRAIYDYFGDKESLFAAVLQRQMTECAEAVPVDGTDLAEYARQLSDFHAGHPEFLRLLLWEALEHGRRPVPAETERAEKYRKRAGAFAEAGRSDAEARMLLFLTIGLVNWGSAVPQLRRMILGEGHSHVELREAVARAVGTLAADPPVH
jgi:AcrR family transcriptional regulator